MLYLHNETVNVVTHLTPAVSILAFLPYLLPWVKIKVPLLPSIHVFACVSPWIGSTIYHLFMNHNGGYQMYRALLMTDMVGIWIAQNLGMV